jgi:hypothetical protein
VVHQEAAPTAVLQYSLPAFVLHERQRLEISGNVAAQSRLILVFMPIEKGNP